CGPRWQRYAAELLRRVRGKELRAAVDRVHRLSAFVLTRTRAREGEVCLAECGFGVGEGSVVEAATGGGPAGGGRRARHALYTLPPRARYASSTAHASSRMTLRTMVTPRSSR